MQEDRDPGIVTEVFKDVAKASLRQDHNQVTGNFQFAFSTLSMGITLGNALSPVTIRETRTVVVNGDR